MPDTSDREITARPLSRLKGTIVSLTALLTVLVTGIVAFFTGIETVLDAGGRVCRRVGICETVPPLPPPIEQPGPMARGFGSFVAITTDPPLTARLRRTLELEGVQLAATGDSAAYRIEVLPLFVGPAEPAPPGGPPLLRVAVTITARIFGAPPETTPINEVQRQAYGLGATAAEAEAKARANAADLLGRRLAEVLR